MSAVRKKEKGRPAVKKSYADRNILTAMSAKPAADAIPLLSIFPPQRPARAPSINPTRIVLP